MIAALQVIEDYNNVRTPGRNQLLLLCFSAGARGETGLLGDPSTDSGGKLGANERSSGPAKL